MLTNTKLRSPKVQSKKNHPSSIKCSLRSIDLQQVKERSALLLVCPSVGKELTS